MSNELAQVDKSLLSEKNFNHQMTVAQHLATSSMVPKAYQGKPMDILIAMDMGIALGLAPLQSIQTIAVINGRPCLYADGLVAVVKGHPHYEWMKEDAIKTGDSVTGYACTIKRKNHPEHTVTFTVDDAKRARLWGKSGPWSDYSSRMLQMRARAFCVRDAFPDALMGMSVAEEVNDYPIDSVRDIKPANVLNELLKKKNKEPEPIKTIVLSSMEQHTEIEALLCVKNFPSSRLEAAYKHYDVTDYKELDFDKAGEFISILSKEPDLE